MKRRKRGIHQLTTVSYAQTLTKIARKVPKRRKSKRRMSRRQTYNLLLV